MLIVFWVLYPAWVGAVDVYNVGSPLFVCACIVGTPVCVLHAGCLNAW